jgi:kynurenine formamidase
VRAIGKLQADYGFGKRYLLVGHSCGATLAYQVAMGIWSGLGRGEGEIDLPLGILGVEGIYDLPVLKKNWKDVPAVQDFIKAAFAQNDLVEDSPTNGKFARSWPNGRLAMVAYSKEDQLIEAEQADLMVKCLKKENEAWGTFLELKGDHDEVWMEPGYEMARAILKALVTLVDKVAGDN